MKKKQLCGKLFTKNFFIKNLFLFLDFTKLFFFQNFFK